MHKYIIKNKQYKEGEICFRLEYFHWMIYAVISAIASLFSFCFELVPLQFYTFAVLMGIFNLFRYIYIFCFALFIIKDERQLQGESLVVMTLPHILLHM